VAVKATPHGQIFSRRWAEYLFTRIFLAAFWHPSLQYGLPAYDHWKLAPQCLQRLVVAVSIIRHNSLSQKA
jgi:hypothetical protein